MYLTTPIEGHPVADAITLMEMAMIKAVGAVVMVTVVLVVEAVVPGGAIMLQRVAMKQAELTLALVYSLQVILVTIIQHQKIIQDKDNDNDPFLVDLRPEDDPKNLPVFRKWLILFVVCTGTLCSTSASSMVCRHKVLLTFALTRLYRPPLGKSLQTLRPDGQTNNDGIHFW